MALRIGSWATIEEDTIARDREVRAAALREAAEFFRLTSLIRREAVARVELMAERAERGE